MSPFALCVSIFATVCYVASLLYYVLVKRDEMVSYLITMDLAAGSANLALLGCCWVPGMRYVMATLIVGFWLLKLVARLRYAAASHTLCFQTVQRETMEMADRQVQHSC